MLNMQFRTSHNQVLILVLLLAAVVQTRRVIRAAPGIKTTGQYMVVLTPDTSHERFEAIAEIVRAQSLNSKIHKIEGPFAKVVVTKLSVDEAHKIKNLDNVEFVEEETFAKASLSWALDRIDQVSPVLDGIFEPGRDGEGVDIYILDTGINYDHYEFDGNRALYTGYDPVDNYDGTDQKGRDCYGHGTHVASLACGKLYGVAKKANCYSVRVLDCWGSGAWSVIIDGLNSAATNITNKNPRRPAIISMSLGGYYTSSVNNVSSNIVNSGIPIVAAAGNDGDDACDYSPASAPGVITVASSAQGDYVSSFTNGGSCVDIFAPGSDVKAADHSCNSCSCTRLDSGTSMAAPLVSGAIALYLQEQPLLTPSEIIENLTENCLKNALDLRFLSYRLRNTTTNCLLHINSSRSRVINSESLLVSGSGMHSKDLTFLDICSQANIFRYADDYTRAVQLPSTFNIGRHPYNTLYISSNGLLSFGTSFASSSTTSFPIPFAVVIAPFWDDIILTNTGIVEYGIFTSSSTSSVINEVERFLKLNQSVDLNLDWVFVAKWDNVCPSINRNCDQTNTFQVVLASEGSSSYAIFTYKCDLLQWTGNKTTIGYSGGQYYFANHQFSRTSRVTDIDCLNYPSSVWSNVVYNVNEEVVFGSGMESKYLTFFDLGLQAKIFRNVDDGSRAVELPSPLNIGRQTFHTLYISSNGLLSLGRSFTSHSSTKFPLSSAVVIAPFWDDIQLTYSGIVEYGIINSSNTSSIINEVEEFLKLNQYLELELDWVMVAKWVNVCPYGNSYCAQTNTFQVVVASEGSTSYAIFTYKCDLLQWTRYSTTIGYSAGHNNFANHPLSRTSRVTDIDCLNYPSSLWSNVVYNLSEGTGSGSGLPSGSGKIEIVTGSGIEPEYLKFLDDLQVKIFRSVDDHTVKVDLPSIFIFGSKTFHSLYISSNGLLSFGTPFTSFVPRSFPLSFAVVIAPFWDDIILTKTGIVEYGIVTSANGSSDINKVEAFLRLNQNIAVELDWVLVAKWVNVCPYGNSKCTQTNTFQVVIASQGSISYAIFTYKCNLLQWTNNIAAIGYSAGNNNFANHPFSRTSRVTDIDCLNYPSSVWSNVVYNLNEVIISSGSGINGTGSGSGAGSGINETISVTPQPSTSIDPTSIIVTPTQTIDITVTHSPTPTMQGSCLALNLTYCGCCKQSLSSQCYDNGCYCDESCHEYNDCCSDIADIDCHYNCYTDIDEPISIINEDN